MPVYPSIVMQQSLVQEEEDEEATEIQNRDRDSILQELVEINTIYLEKNDKYKVMEYEYAEATKVWK